MDYIFMEKINIIYDKQGFFLIVEKYLYLYICIDNFYMFKIDFYRIVILIKNDLV